jgi:manganese transport protein
VFDVVLERLGARWALVNLGASFFINLLTVAAEIGGLALVIELVTGLNYLLWVPLLGIAVWIALWKLRFSVLEKIFGISGLALIATAFALWRLDPGLHQTWQAVGFGPPASEGWAVYAFFAIALLGAAMTPYEVFFFSSGGVEERWSVEDLATSRLNVMVGFPLGGVLSVAIAACAAIVLLPAGIGVNSMSQLTLPVAQAGGRLLVAVVIVGLVAATFGAALETALSTGYTLSQYQGWSWGKFRRPVRAARFHLAMILVLVVAVGVLMTNVDPIAVTEYSVVFSAVALPLTYLPILIVANDPEYMGEHVNGRTMNLLGMVYLVILVVAATAAIPLMIVTEAGG